MSACAVQSLVDAIPINLGVRIGVIGSEAFTNWVRGVVQMDNDVASVITSKEITLLAADRPLNLLIVDAASLGRAISAELKETLAAISLIAITGLTADGYAPLPNVTVVDVMSPDWWPRLKQQTVQRRFQELYMLMNALAGDSDNYPDCEETFRIDQSGENSDVPVSSVDWIRAAGNYVELRVNGRSHLLRSEMHNVQRRLTQSFLRIHRRVIINTQRLIRLEYGDGSRMFAILATGDRFPISRARRQLVQSRWEELRRH
jgi:DNA-binding LytR/AlgR family response regulator